MSRPSLQYLLYLKANHSLSFLEAMQVSRNEVLDDYPPIFILGAPRCGSTLLYQAMVAQYEFSYFSNLHCRLFGAPWFIERIYTAKKHHVKNLAFNSKYGSTKGLSSPSECGEYWYRFFRKEPQYTPLNEIPNASLEKLRKSYLAFVKVSKTSLLIKNLICTVRLEPILNVFPYALFIVLHRNTLDTAHSILEARFKLNNNYNQWFSVEPPSIDLLKTLSPEAQVVEQIRSVYELINNAEANAPGRFLHINYEQFCASTKTTFKKIDHFLESFGVAVKKNDIVPEKFTMRSDIRIERALYDKVVAYISQNPI